MDRLFVALLFVAGSAAASAAQEVEIFAHRGSSDLSQLESTSGLGIAGRFPLLERLDLHISLSARSGTSSATEEVCVQWQPRWGCGVEGVAYESSLQEASVVLLPVLLRTDRLRLAAGGGMTLNKLRSTGKGDSGLPVAVNMPSGAQRGFIGTADVSLSPGRRSPWAVVMAAKIHRAELDGCTPDDPNIPVVERFCGSYTFKEVRVGVAFRF
jgi:hypothetical protein